MLIDRAVDVIARRHSVPRDLTGVTVHGNETGSPRVADELWARVEDLYRTGMHPGIQVCIRHRGEVVVDRAIGHARGVRPGRRFDPDRAVPMRTDTPVNLFSASKSVTAMAVHKLDELGELSLDDRIAEHVPGFGRHRKGGITVRHVLSHRAGIPVLPGEAYDLDRVGDPDWVEAMVCDLRPVGPPGGPPAYHAVVGGFVLEVVARRAAGRSLREVLETEIRRPLGLDRLSMGVGTEEVELVADNVATGLRLLPALELFMYRALGGRWGRLLDLSNDPRFLTAVIPSVNVIVTARDVAAFYQCLLDGGQLDGTRVFTEATVARALEHQGEGLPVDRMLGVPMRYGAGFMLGHEQASLYGWDHPRAFGHVGMSNLFTWADPDRDLVVALLDTGKPVLGTHVLALPQFIAGIHEAFPPDPEASGRDP